MFIKSAFALLAATAAVLGHPLQPRAPNQVIRSYRTNTCLTLIGTAQNNALVGAGPCATATRWTIAPGSGSVIITGTNFALDAGVPQQNNNPAKIYQSYPGSPQQTWYLTADNRIAVTGGNQCLDYGPNGPQTYQCITGNTNQIWYVENPSGPTTTQPPPTTPPPTTPPTTTPPPTVTGRQLQWGPNRSICATVQGGTGGNGVFVNAQNCFNPTSPAGAAQLFNFMGNGLIMFAGSNFCLDAGSNPASGTQMKLWQCYVGAPQQTWNFPSGTGLFRTANNQCLNLDSGNLSRVQTWTCSAPDPQEQWVAA